MASGGNITFIHGDATTILKQKRAKYNKIIGNIPYSISEPLLKSLFLISFKCAVLITGERFFNILNDTTTRIGYLTQACFEIKKGFPIGREKFNPSPRVDSMTFIISPKVKKSQSEHLLTYMTKQYSMKLKNTLRESLIIVKGGSKREIKKQIEDAIPLKILDKQLFTISEIEFFEVMEKIKLLLQDQAS